MIILDAFYTIFSLYYYTATILLSGCTAGLSRERKSRSRSLPRSCLCYAIACHVIVKYRRAFIALAKSWRVNSCKVKAVGVMSFIINIWYGISRFDVLCIECFLLLAIIGSVITIGFFVPVSCRQISVQYGIVFCCVP